MTKSSSKEPPKFGAKFKFTCKHAIAAGKKVGDVRAYFATARRGAPTKHNPYAPPPDPAPAPDPQPVPAHNLAAMKPPPSKKAKTARLSFRNRENFTQLRKLLIQFHCAEDAAERTAIIKKSTYPDQTVRDNYKKMKECSELNEVPFEAVSYEMFWQKALSSNAPGFHGLLKSYDIEVLQSLIVSRDNANASMTRSEVVSHICDLTGTTDRQKAGNAFDHLRRSQQLPELKRGGKTVAAQATTTQRGAITPEQQLRNYNTITYAFDEQKKLNKPDGTGVLFDDVHEFFVVNIDETGYMANSDNKIRVIAGANKRKTEINTDDCRASVTSLRVGSAGGIQGPNIFIAKAEGKSGEATQRMIAACLRDPSFPDNSVIHTAKSAYVTNESWLKLVPDLCKGIRNMDVVRDHPNWWVVVSLDGYGSHIDVLEAYEIFAKHKILLMKEEGDASQVNQAYDQFVAKADKEWLRNYLHNFRVEIGTKMDQWYLITLAAQAQAQIKPELWIKSFIRVNFHPKYRLTFDDWLKKLDERGILESGKFYLSEHGSLYDCMPMFWRRMPVEVRHSFISTVDKMYEDAKEKDEPAWTPDRISKNIIKFVKVEDVVRSRACYFAAKKDGLVITTTEEEYKLRLRQLERDMSRDMSKGEIPKFFHPMPEEKVKKFKEAKEQGVSAARAADRMFPNQAAQDLFTHMCNTAEQEDWEKDKVQFDQRGINPMYLKEGDQEEIVFKPKPKNVTIGSLKAQVVGKGAQRKVAARRLHAVTCNPRSYAQVLNHPNQMNEVKEILVATASCATISRVKDQQAKERRQNAAKKAKKKEADKKTKSDAFEKARDEKIEGLKAFVDKCKEEAKNALEDGAGGDTYTDAIKMAIEMSRQKNDFLKDVIRFYFRATVKGSTKGKYIEQLVALFNADK